MADISSVPVDPPPLVIGARAPTESCAGDSVDIELQASGGITASHQWRVSGDTGGLSPLEGTGSHLLLSGVPTDAGNIELEVELSDGATIVTQSIALSVHGRPRIVTAGWPALCPGEVTHLPIAAEGGDATSYEYSAAIDPLLGLSLTAAGLVGRFAPPAAVSSSVVLSVRDRFCASSPTELALDVLAAGSGVCPQIRVAAADAMLDQLPPPCLGNDYEQVFVASPAEEAAHPLSWREVAMAPGLHFDATERAVRGTPRGSGLITLQVENEEGRIIEADFPVVTREHCWLAYLAAPAGARRLHLFDPRLPTLPASRRVYPAVDAIAADAGAGDDVLDFAFSARGRFLAYRMGPEDASTLRLIDLWSWSEHALDFADSIKAYAWSPAEAAGDALAVAFVAAGEPRLGGLVLSPAVGDADPSEDRAPIPFAPYELTYFQSAPVTVHTEQLTWFDADRVGFFAPDPWFEPGRLFQSARFDSGVVSPAAVSERLEFFDGARFLAAPRGVIVLEPSTTRATFFGSDGDEIDHRGGTLVAPSGAFTARVADGVLQIFRVTDRSVLDTDPVWAQVEGCSSILAWARGRERIACAVAAEGDQRLAFFDLLPDAEPPELARLDRVQGEYRFLSGQHVGQPRLFAQGGGRFAFSTDSDIYVVQLDDGAPRIEVAAEALASSNLPIRPVQLSFPANGSFFAVHAGASVAVWNLETEGHRGGRVPRVLPAPAACSESAYDAASWCGAEASEPNVRWSADADAFAFLTLDGGLEVEDLSLGYPAANREIAVDPSCTDGCIVPGAYRFQP